jgi:chorismate mutase/prephenate dehydratase
MTDDELTRFRAQITDLDREILAAVNRRLQLVADLRRYKDEHGLPFVDPAREAQLLEEHVRENAGPLSDAGVRSLLQELLALMKRELP